MGQISLSIPQSGLPNSTEQPKVASDLTTIQTVINGNIDDSNLFSPNGAVRKLLLQTDGLIGGSQAGPLYFFDINGQAHASGATTAGTPVRLWQPDTGLSGQPQDFQVANKAAYARIRVTLCTNATASGVTFTAGLYPLAGLGGAASFLIYSFGSVIAGSTVGLTTPPAAIVVSAETAQFALPVAGNPCAVGVALSGATAANAMVTISAQLYGYNA